MTDCATIAEARIIASEYEGTRAVRADGGILAPNVVRFANLAVSLAAVVAALPKCADCGALATRYAIDLSGWKGRMCDAHAPADLRGIAEFPYAAALRALDAT